MIISFLANIKGGSSGSGYSITTKAITLDDKTEVLEAPDNVAWNKVSINAVHVYDSGYTSGYTNGYASGSTDGFGSGYASGYTDGESVGYASGYTNGEADGFSSGYTSGFTDGCASSLGIVADFTGVGFKVPYNPNYIIELNFITPSYSATPNDKLFVLSKGGYDSLGNDDGGPSIYCQYSDTYNCNVVTTQHFPQNLNKPGYGNNEFSIKIENVATSSTLSYNAFAETTGTIKPAYGVGMNSAMDDYVAVFAMRYVNDSSPIEPGLLSRYLKSFKMYDDSIENGGVLIHNVVPRKDGKMWDLVTNQETDIVFDKYDGTHPTTFTIVSEHNI